MINQGNTIQHPIECKCLSWRPIVAGALVAIGLSFLLNLFAVAIGLTAFTTNAQGVENIALGGMIATELGIVAAMFGSGWIAGYLGHRHCSKAHLGALYGFLTWCIALIVTVFLANHIHHYVVYYTHFISGTAMMNDASVTHAMMQMTGNEAPGKSMMISGYIVFSLFFLSAFACSLGGHCGMRHCCRNTNIKC